MATPYCANADVQRFLGVAITIGAATRGAVAADVDALRADIAGEINAALGVGNVLFPLTDTSLQDDLKRLNAVGVAGQILITAFPTSAGPGSSSLGQAYWTMYQERLAAFRKGQGISATVIRTNVGHVVENYFTANGGIGNPDGLAVDAWGDSVYVEPAFRISKQL